MIKIILLFPIIMFLTVNLALANDSDCSYFYPKLSELPHIKLTQNNNGFKSLWETSVIITGGTGKGKELVT